LNIGICQQGGTVDLDFLSKKSRGVYAPRGFLVDSLTNQLGDRRFPRLKKLKLKKKKMAIVVFTNGPHFNQSGFFLPFHPAMSRKTSLRS